MKKFYMLILLVTVVPYYAVNSMEQNIPEGKQEVEDDEIEELGVQMQRLPKDIENIIKQEVVSDIIKNTEYFLELIFEGELEQVALLIQLDPLLVNAKDSFNATALMYAINNDHKDLVYYLLKKGASVNDQNNGGTTALMYAAFKGDLDMVKTLIEQYGADKNITDNNGETALDYAEDENYGRVVEYLQK